MFQKNALLSSLENYTKELGVIGEQNDNNLSYSSLKVKYLKKSVNIYTFLLVPNPLYFSFADFCCFFYSIFR